MTEDEVTKRIDRLEDTINNRLTRLEATIALMMEKLAMAPGSAYACQAHTAKLNELELRLSVMERKFWVAAGGLAALTFLISLFAPAIRSALRLGP